MVLDGHVLALDIPGFSEGVAKRGRIARGAFGRPRIYERDHRHRRLLRARRERPRRRRAAEQRGQEFSSSDVACHVTLRLGVIHAIGALYHASIARSVTERSISPATLRLAPAGG